MAPQYRYFCILQDTSGGIQENPTGIFRTLTEPDGQVHEEIFTRSLTWEKPVVSRLDALAHLGKFDYVPMGDAAVVERYIEHVTVNGGPAAPGEPGTFTADEALDLVREHDHDDCPLRAAYDAASEKGQRQLRDAAEQLVVELGDECPDAAVVVLRWSLWWFPERDRLDRLVAHYLEYGPFEQLGAVLRSQAGGLQRTHVQQLDPIVAADPLRHEHVCVAILRSPHDEGSAVWKALKDRTRQSTDPAELASIHDVTVQAGVHADFYEILGSRALSRKVLEATADRIKRDAFLFRSTFTD